MFGGRGKVVVGCFGFLNQPIFVYYRHKFTYKPKAYQNLYLRNHKELISEGYA